MKIRTAEVEIIGLTEIAKKEKKYETSVKDMAFPVTTVTGWPNKRVCIVPKGRNFRGAARARQCATGKGEKRKPERRGMSLAYLNGEFR